ncbi:hypothetical protein LQ327_12075 [Actinomycetospora endophytica]|uniref:RDD family protein n=1 Tax=Actinomycetospora endophytica TaxID=2291215 RepID=A0ABS8P769_9PSEU|nr:hypothetical protein [Actinomycetospora endophytica]MCD2194112.1 hypothetical protein [Actinomycetospora endophytica]
MSSLALPGPRLLLYAERPRRRLLQMITDLAVAVWVVLVVTAAIALHDTVLALQAPGRGLTSAGDQVRGVFAGAARAADGVPLVGDRLSGAFTPGTDAGGALADAGRAQVEAVAAIATGVAWLVVAVAAVPVVTTWFALRLRWVLKVRQALAARDLDVDLLALRALVRGDPGRVRRAAGPDGDPAGAWRRGEPRMLLRLADLELRRMGLRGATSVTSSARSITRSDPPGDA